MDLQNGSSEPDASRERIEQLTGDLSSIDAATRLKAAVELGELAAGNRKSLRALERAAAQDPSEQVRAAALSALGSPANRALSRRRTVLPPASRKLILNAIDAWVRDGILTEPLADVLRSRYALPPKQAPAERVKPAGARPSLSQVLLSETSIRIALFLGGFFVVAAAFIVAAVIEAARIPVLMLLTAAFLTTALAFRRRLQAASFILYAVFTLLLVIDAWVLSQGAVLRGDELLLFWAIVSAVMAAVWAGSTALYTSRLFSLFAFSALSAAVMLFGELAEADLHARLLMLQSASALGLAAASALTRWKGTDLGIPTFLAVHLQLLITLLISLGRLTSSIAFPLGTDPVVWASIAATWLIGALLYAASHRMFQLRLFHFLAILTVLPVPQLFVHGWSPDARTVLTVAWLWGAALAIAGERAGQAGSEQAQSYSPILIGASAPLFAYAGLGWTAEDTAVGSALLLGSALIYLGLMLRRRRAWIWMGALTFALFAYLSFLLGPDLEVKPGYVLLLASIMLLTGWVGAEKWLRARSHWLVAPLMLGILTAVAASGAFLLSGLLDETREAAIGLGLLAAYLYGLGAVRGTPPVGFAASGSLSFSLLFVLVGAGAEARVIPFTGLALGFYLAGLALGEAGGSTGWSRVLSLSGRWLGAVVGIAAPLEGGEWAALGAAVVASMFALEAALQRRVALGYPAILYYLIAYFMLLAALEVTDPQAYSIGPALLGFVMHYLLVRAGSPREAFVMGGLSQLVLLGTTYIQMLVTERFSFFFVLFFQSLVVLAYGVVVRSRSLILAPIVFSILGVVSVAFSVLAGVRSAILIGCTGLIMIVLGVLALLYRDRVLAAGRRLGESFGGWMD